MYIITAATPHATPFPAAQSQIYPPVPQSNSRIQLNKIGPMMASKIPKMAMVKKAPNRNLKKARQYVGFGKTKATSKDATVHKIGIVIQNQPPVCVFSGAMLLRMVIPIARNARNNMDSKTERPTVFTDIAIHQINNEKGRLPNSPCNQDAKGQFVDESCPKVLHLS